MKDVIIRSLNDHARVFERLRDQLTDQIEAIAQCLVECIGRGNTVFWCGNGGSASDAEHLAAELVGRFNRDRRALPAVALTTNTSTLTAVANDYGFAEIFARQVHGLARPGDVLVGLSTSGNSDNVSRAIDAANDCGATTIGLLGRDGGRIAEQCELSLVVPDDDTARIQEMHILIGHILCDIVEQNAMA